MLRRETRWPIIEHTRTAVVVHRGSGYIALDGRGILPSATTLSRLRYVAHPHQHDQLTFE